MDSLSVEFLFHNVTVAWKKCTCDAAFDFFQFVKKTTKKQPFNFSLKFTWKEFAFKKNKKHCNWRGMTYLCGKTNKPRNKKLTGP